MKLSNSKQRISSVGSNGKGFRRPKQAGSSRLPSGSSAGKTQAKAGMTTAVHNAADVIHTRVRKWKAHEINWRSVSASDNVFREMAASKLGPNAVLPTDLTTLLFAALKVFSVSGLQFAVGCLGGEDVPSTKASLVPIVVELLLNREHATVSGDPSKIGSVSAKDEQKKIR